MLAGLGAALAAVWLVGALGGPYTFDAGHFGKKNQSFEGLQLDAQGVPHCKSSKQVEQASRDSKSRQQGETMATLRDAPRIFPASARLDTARFGRARDASGNCTTKTKGMCDTYP